VTDRFIKIEHRAGSDGVYPDRCATNSRLRCRQNKPSIQNSQATSCIRYRQEAPEEPKLIKIERRPGFDRVYPERWLLRSRRSRTTFRGYRLETTLEPAKQRLNHRSKLSSYRLHSAPEEPPVCRKCEHNIPGLRRSLLNAPLSIDAQAIDSETSGLCHCSWPLT
jgi:hypothetical protein